MKSINWRQPQKGRHMPEQSRTTREIGRIVVGGYYDHQMVRTAMLNRIRDLVRHINEGISFDRPEEKREEGGYDKKYADANLPGLVEQMFKEGKVTAEEKIHLLKALEVAKKAASLEQSHLPLMKAYISAEPLWTEFLGHIKGLGPVLGSNIIKAIGDGSRYDSVSALWRHFGYHLVCPKCAETIEEDDGRKKTIPLLVNAQGKCQKCGANGVGPKKMKGRSIDFDPRLRTIAWKISASFIKQQTPVYAEIYYKEKARQQARAYPAGELRATYGDFYELDNTKLKDLHAHNRALRKTIKIFLQHCWVASRTIASLPVTDPYVQTQLGHNPEHIITWQQARDTNANAKKGKEDVA